MPLIITQIKSSLNEPTNSIISKALKSARIQSASAVKTAIYKTSLDCRKQNEIHLVHSVYVKLENEERERELCQRNKFCTYIENIELNPVISDKKADGRVVVAGFGPAGMFCALLLAEYGYKPIVLERGEALEERIKAVEGFWNGGELKRSNVQFGEGGAGTFSDGKLTTRIKDSLCRYVLERFVEFEAPEEILTNAKPHIGTDKLRDVVKNIRNRITECGGEIHFCSRLDNFDAANGSVNSVRSGAMQFDASALVLAIGHSARDTFELLQRKDIAMEAKPFSVGVRIEHTQSEVDVGLYGANAGNSLLPKGEYQLSCRHMNGRAAYTFCMCPGGVVVPAASENGGVVTNGMSFHARNGKNANSAVAVAVSPDDFGSAPLDGVKFAQNIERKAFEMGGGEYKAPATTLDGFLKGKPNLNTDIEPTYSRGVKECDFTQLFPDYVTEMLKLGINDFSKKLSCFGNKKAILTAPETRTSSPVRIIRTSEMNSLSIENLYPCGEGAGYAGGIMSAAVDGIKAALKIMERISPNK